jgi:hypothetical protein
MFDVRHERLQRRRQCGQPGAAKRRRALTRSAASERHRTDEKALRSAHNIPAASAHLQPALKSARPDSRKLLTIASRGKRHRETGVEEWQSDPAAL